MMDPRNHLGRPASGEEVDAVYRTPRRRGPSLSRTGLGEDAWAGILDWLR
jgi:hypothetical protein